MDVIKKILKYKKQWNEVKRERYIFMNQTEERRRSMNYAEAYKKNKINSDMILYESYWGRGVVDNPYALFKKLLNCKEFKRFLHIWVLDDFESNKLVIEYYKNYSNVEFVLFGSEEYHKALTSAKYLVNNVTFPKYFIKKEGQVYINTWHGTPLKSMGFDMVDGNSGSANTIRNFLHADYLLSANETMTKMYFDSYKLQGIFSGEIIEEGYPRNDLLLCTNKELEYSVLEKNGITVEREKKIILFAPTWREKEDGTAEVNPKELLEVKEILENNIDTTQYQILIKPHQFVYNQLKDLDEYKGLLIPATIDANELMSIVDILISDYSSIFLDYMVLDRPILFYIPDLVSYKEKRGLNVQPEDLPGPFSDNLYDIAEYINKIDQIQIEYYTSYQKMKESICRHDDGKVSSRIVNYIFNGTGKCCVLQGNHDKKRLLISCGGLLENGITHSFLSLLEQIDYEEWDVTALVGDNPKDIARHYKVNHMNSNVRPLVICGFRAATLEEEQRREFVTKHGVYNKFWKKVYPWELMKRENRRFFGDVKFDYIVDFQGYNTILTPMLLQREAKKKSIWLHNDMQADMNKKVNGKKKNWECLYFNISLYPYFDNLVSCSNEVMKVNRQKLSTNSTYLKFKSAKNTVNEERIKKYLENESTISIDGVEYLIKNELKENNDAKSLEIIELPQKDYINFVTMGRMSVEKNHIALIRAFDKVHSEYKNTRLYLLGSGPLEDKIKECITNLKLENAVILTGNINNPFAVMKRSSCFILPSIHEGQPMVLLEARTCDLPIIVSNFSTVKDSLYPDGQLLIGNDEDSIYNGLKSYINGKVPTCDFRLSDYNNEAYEEFKQAIQ